MRMRQVRPVATLGAVILAAGGMAGCGGAARTARQTADQFVSAWNRGDGSAMARLVYQPAPTFSSDLSALTAHLGATGVERSIGPVKVSGSDATGPLSATYQLPGVGAWTDPSGTLQLVHHGSWLVSWSPTAIDSRLRSGDHLGLSYQWPERAAITGAGGSALTGLQPQVTVGVEGSRIKDPANLTSVLEAAGATPGQVSAALTAAAAHPTYFEAVMTLSEAQYTQLGGDQSALYTEPGTVFQKTSARAAITAGLAEHIVGSIGPITADELKQLGPPYGVGSDVGQTGLEAGYEKQLAGRPGATISVVDAAGHPVATVATFQPTPGTPVATGIDPAVQKAGESALAGLTGTAALVAVRASTGAILASVSLPSTSQFDEALGGAFPPGSTFKILTSAALFGAGLSPSSPASCPPTVTIDGETFHNAEGDAPVASLGQAFTESCNTAFVQLATAHLQPPNFPAVATQFGIGSSWSIGLPAFSGKVPTPKDQADMAATAIGQGSVVMSPLVMAMVAAAVDSGSVRSPQLVAGAGPTSPAQPLPAGLISALRQMMATVVMSGTAAGTGLPAGTYAKTGTAEYGSGNPLPTDAWLVGYRGDVAFAMVVQNSKGDGGPVDGPIVARFLDALPAGYG